MSRGSDEERITGSNADIEWNLNVSLHDAQREIWEDDHRFQVVAAGRRFGKTMLAGVKAIAAAAAKPDAEVMWVSPSHAQSREAMRWIAKQIPKPYRSINHTMGEIHLASGGRIQFRSAERYDNIRGVGLDLAVIDEAAFVPQAVWTQVLRPALADRRGRAFFISTFSGENWFYEMWRAAHQPKYKEWRPFKFVSTDSPFFPPAELEESRRTMAKEEFEQEYLCSPISFKGAVFDSHALVAAIEAGENYTLGTEPHPHLGGVDWGWQVTAVELCFETQGGLVVWDYEELFLQVGLEERCERLCDLAYNFGIVAYFTDQADPSANYALAQSLHRRGLSTFVQPVPFNAYKIPGIRARSMFLHQGREILTPRCPQAIIDSRAYKIDPVTDKPAKGNDHTVDAMTAFYACKIDALGEAPGMDLDEEETNGVAA